MSLKLSVLDLIPLAAGTSSSQALRNSLELARVADRLGYFRHWFAEHHNMPTVLSTTPELMIAMAGEVTSHIRVGSGGVMLPNHSPIQVAEAFKMLEALHPGRIDLGIGRAPGTDPATKIAIRRSRDAEDAEDFPARLAELLAFGKGGIPAERPMVMAMPQDVPLPPIILLGSSGYSAQVAAILGMGFGFAAHFSDLPPEEPMLDYRRQFSLGGALESPWAILTLSVICAETDELAKRQAASVLVAFTRLRTGQKSLLLSPKEALAYQFSPLEQAVADVVRNLHIVGSVATVKRKIDDLVARTQADEVMITTFIHSHAERLRSYELLAEAYQLSSPVTRSSGA